MSLITKYNYEAYLLDYVEENLSPELIAELMLFLEQNPEFKRALDEFEIIELVPLEANGFDKSTLKKGTGIVDSSNYENFIIAEVEGDNSLDNSNALHLFLKQHSEKRKEFLIYQKTKLVGTTILYENKRALKKKAGIIVLMNWRNSATAAAAIIIVLFSLNWVNREDQVYYPLADREGIDIQKNYLNDGVLEDVFILEENGVAVVEKKTPRIKDKTINRKAVIESKLWVKSKLSSNEEENELAKVSENDQAIDRTELKKSKENDVSDIEYENVLLAENNVTITYEDELLDGGTPNVVKRKITKLDLVKAAVEHKFNGNLNKGKEKILFALNTKPLNFLRKKKK